MVAVSQSQPLARSSRLTAPRRDGREEERRGTRRPARISLQATPQRRTSRSILSDGGGKGSSAARVSADMDPDEELRFVPASEGWGGGSEYDCP